MRKEGDITRDVTKAIREALPGAVVIKHAERFSSGVPDFSVTYFGRTLWFEAKRETNWPPTAIQSRTMHGLNGHGSGAFYLVYHERAGKTRLGWLAAGKPSYAGTKWNPDDEDGDGWSNRNQEPGESLATDVARLVRVVITP